MAAPQIKFGYLPDPPDMRDRTFGTLLRARPLKSPEKKVDLRPFVHNILNQKALGSCVAHGVLGAIRLRHKLSGVKSPKIGGRLHTYWGARSYIGTGEWDSGSHLRDAFRFINSFGYMPESETDNGYDISKFKSAPTPREQRLMYDQRDKGKGQVSYYRIFESGEARKEAIQIALSNGVIPVLGTETTKAFLEYKKGILGRPKPTDQSTGGHAFYLCGYDQDCVIAANSWDDDYGEQGFMRLGWDYILWNETRDIWGVEEAPYFSHLLEAA